MNYITDKKLLLVLLLVYCSLSIQIRPAQAQQLYSETSKKTVLGSDTADSAKTPIMILATTHLSRIQDEFEPLLLDSLIQVLSKYKPKVVAIESPRDKYYAKTQTGKLMQSLGNINLVHARQLSDSLLNVVQQNKSDDIHKTRLQLIKNLAAAH